MSTSARVDVEGADAAAYNLERIAARARDVRGVKSKVRSLYERSEQRRFDHDGYGWPPLAASTVARKRQAGLDPRTLRARNVLYRSLTEPNAAMRIDDSRPDEFRFGTEVPYARFHEHGRGVPRRKLIELRRSDRKAISEAISAFVAKGER